MLRTFTLLLALAVPASAQIFQAEGGSGNLYQASGGGVTAYVGDSQVYAGGGCAFHRCGIGLSDTFQFHGYRAIAGDSNFGFAVDGAGTGILVRGLQIQKTSPDGQNTTAAFVGASSLGLYAPYFQSLVPQHIAFGMFVRRHYSRVSLASLATLSGGMKTALGSATYTGNKLHGYVSGGVLNNRPEVNAVADYSIRPSLRIAAAHTNYFLPEGKITADNANVFGRIGHVSFFAGAVASTTRFGRLHGENAGSTVTFGPVSASAFYYVQHSGNLLVATGQEQFSRHWRLTETMQHSHDNNSFSVGGGYTSNRISVSLEKAVMFLPFSGGYQNVTTLTLSMRLPHDAAVTTTWTELPNKRVLYGASATDWAHGPLNLQASNNPHRVFHSHSGKYEHTGKVTNRKGEPVAGAAVMLGKETVFSDDAGKYMLHAKKSSLPLHVEVEQFVAPGTYSVVSCPETSEAGSIVTVVVELN